MDNPHGLKTGQKLFLVGNVNCGHRGQREIEIKSVGRVWATAEKGQRINLKSLLIDGKGYASPGQCYLSEDVYRNSVERQQSWNSIRKTVSDAYRCPTNATIEDLTKIEQIMEGWFK